MTVTQETKHGSAVHSAFFLCGGPAARPEKECIRPIMEHGTEVLHVLSGPETYEVYAKMGGLLYSLDDEVLFVLDKNGTVMLRNPENENDRTLFTIPEWLFKQDFSPADDPA